VVAELETVSRLDDGFGQPDRRDSVWICAAWVAFKAGSLVGIGRGVGRNWNGKERKGKESMYDLAIGRVARMNASHQHAISSMLSY